MISPSLLPMDSSSPSLKRKRDLHPSLSAGQADLRRLSPLDRSAHRPWKHGKSDHSHGHGCSESSTHLSRLDKARSFAKRDVDARNGAKSGGSSGFAYAERRYDGGNIERGGFERGEMQRSLPSARKGHGNSLKQINADEKQERVWKSAEEDGRKLPTASAFRTSSKHRTASSDNDTSPSMGYGSDKSLLKREALGHGDPSSEQPKKSAEIKSFKRIIKLKTKHSSGILETSDTSKDSNSKVCKEEKHLVCSPSKSNNGSSDELSSKSSLSARACKAQKPLPSSSELISADMSVAEPPIPFMHVTRRARSERKRDDSCKIQAGRVVCLDGFGAELEEALLENQEAEVNSEEQLLAGTEKILAEREAGIALSTTVCDAALSVGLNGSHKATPLEEADEREEGELEPEDEVSEKHSDEVRNTVEHGEAFDLQTESKSEDCDNLENQCKEPFDRQELHSDPSNHDMTVSTADSNKDALEVMETHDASKSDTVVSSDVMEREEKVIGDSRICERVSDDVKEGNGDAHVINLNPANPYSNGSVVNVKQIDTSLHVEGDGLPERIDITLPVEPSPHGTHESPKTPETHEQLFNALVTGERRTDGNSKVQLEGADTRDSAFQVEEPGKLPVYEHKQKRQKVGSLQLSLALPGCPLGSSNFPSGPVERDISRASDIQRPAQSLSHLRTESMSDGFTASLSLSSFVHNPSCSLNCISHEDQELSCGGSRQISQGRWAESGGDDRGLYKVNKCTTSEPKCKPDAPIYQQVLENGKSVGAGSGLPLHTLGVMDYGNNQASQKNQQVASGHGSFATQNRFQMINSHTPSFVPKSLSERSRRVEDKSVSNVKLGPFEIASEPIAAMAQKLQELPDSVLEGLKGVVKEMLGSFAKREEFLALQEIIRTRTDLTEETLLRAHPTQLEILVALKTGMQSFVQQGARTLTYKALIEIFLQTKCRNVDCQQPLPVDGCECKICSEKKGFCHECMCMVCSKFDSDTNTSRWVGCDVCMHWCHTDCGIRMSHIRSTPVSCNGIESHEMQFQCISCNHCMELFGFVKAVFKNFASTWGAEALAKELDCVRRIFHGSEDGREKQLCWKAEEMLQMLERNVAAHDVCNRMLCFFSEGDNKLGKSGLIPPVPPKIVQPSEVIDHMEGAEKAFATMGSMVARKFSDPVDNTEQDRRERQGAGSVQKEDHIDNAAQDLRSIIEAKLTDVLMYQARADAAREDAINLEQIIFFKSKTMEDDYRLSCAKLGVNEAEEQRSKCLKDLLALEQSHREYQIIKLRIESDMKNLRMKTVERSKPQLA